MCGRFAQIIKNQYLKKYLNEIKNIEMTIPINFNVAPTQAVGTIFLNNKDIFIDMMRWKLLPSWAKESSSYSIINTRIDSVEEKAFWKGLFKHKRCLIPATGFYEWRKRDKQPYFIRNKNEELIFMAGIYDIKNLSDGSLYHGFSILTMPSNDDLSGIHHRMPIILEINELSDYLYNPDFHDLLIKCHKPPTNLTFYPVSKKVNSISNNYPQLITETNLDDNLTLF